nr:hypothetical protein CFP56_25754 [Quercus suber]
MVKKELDVPDGGDGLLSSTSSLAAVSERPLGDLANSSTSFMESWMNPIRLTATPCPGHITPDQARWLRVLRLATSLHGGWK